MDSSTPQTLTLGFGTPDYASGLVIREVSGNGFITQVELLDTDNVYHTVSGFTDTSTSGVVHDLVVSFATTGYLVKGVRLTVDANHAEGEYEAIDAVRLVTSAVTTAATPDAVNDTDITTSRNLPVVIDVLANDSNPGRISITSGPAHGTVFIDANGTLNDPSDDFATYTPEADYAGSDSFTCDGPNWCRIRCQIGAVWIPGF